MQVRRNHAYESIPFLGGATNRTKNDIAILPIKIPKGVEEKCVPKNWFLKCSRCS
jgi:hypothetical protein